MDLTPDQMLSLIRLLSLFVLAAALIGLTPNTCNHSECRHLHDKLAHADRVKTETARHAFHHPGYPARDCTSCRPVEPK